MKIYKPLLLKFPEYYLVMLTILAVYKQPFVVALVPLGLIILLVLQIIYQNKITGFIIAGIFFFVNLYMLGALISEFKEFTEVNAAATTLLSVGLTLIIFNFFVSIVMIYKYGFFEKTLKIQSTEVM